jgi:hypothetical protein
MMIELARKWQQLYQILLFQILTFSTYFNAFQQKHISMFIPTVRLQMLFTTNSLIEVRVCLLGCTAV